MDIAEAAMCLSVHVGIGNWYQKMGISIDYAIIVIVTCINKLVRLPSYFSLFVCTFNKRHKNNSVMLTSQVGSSLDDMMLQCHIISIKLGFFAS